MRYYPPPESYFTRMEFYKALNYCGFVHVYASQFIIDNCERNKTIKRHFEAIIDNYIDRRLETRNDRPKDYISFFEPYMGIITLYQPCSDSKNIYVVTEAYRNKLDMEWIDFNDDDYRFPECR